MSHGINIADEPRIAIFFSANIDFAFRPTAKAKSAGELTMLKNNICFLYPLCLLVTSCRQGALDADTSTTAPLEIDMKTFTGAQVGEGLDLNGHFVHAVNMGGSKESKIGDALFTPSTDAAEHFTQSFNRTWKKEPKIEYGATAEDNALAQDVMSVVRYTTKRTGSVQLGALQRGRRYKLQLLWHETHKSGTDNMRVMDIFVENQLVVDNLDLFDHGSRPGTDKGIVLTVYFEAQQKNDSLDVRIVKDRSSRLAPFLSALTVEDVTDSVTVFNGAQPHQGLDLDGDFVYAVNMGGTANTHIRDATFTSQSSAGPHFEDSFKGVWTRGKKPEYGATEEDDILEEHIMQPVAYPSGSSSAFIRMGGLRTGSRYKLQLIWHEVEKAASKGTRVMDVFVENRLVVDDLDLADHGSQAAGHQGVVLTVFFEAEVGNDVLDIRIKKDRSSRFVPTLNALTLEDVTGPIRSFTGADAGEGLDLDGDFVYAVNMGGATEFKVRDAAFTTVSGSGEHFSHTLNKSWTKGAKPNYGSSAKDKILANHIMQRVRYPAGGKEAAIAMGGLQKGRRYKLQLLWHAINNSAAKKVRVMDVYVEDELLFDNLNLADHQSRPKGNRGVVLTVFFHAERENDTLDIRIAKNSSSDLVPMLNALTLEDVTNPITGFTGPDSDRGLDLEGDFVYAVNMGGTGQTKMGNATFRPASDVGADFSHSFDRIWAKGTKPDYGPAREDNTFEEQIMGSVGYSLKPSPDLKLGGLQQGHRYKLQLIWHEIHKKGVDNARTMDVLVEGRPVVTELDLFDLASVPGGEQGVVLTVFFDAKKASDVLDVTLRKAKGSKLPVMLNALTLEDMTTELNPPPFCKKGTIMNAVLRSGRRAEPCKGFIIDVPLGAVSSDTEVTFEFEANPAQATINGKNIFQKGLVQLIHMEPSMTFQKPLAVTMSSRLLGARSGLEEYAVFLADDTHDPETGIKEIAADSLRFSVPHFSQQAIYDWSSMGHTTQKKLWDWIAEFYTTKAPPMSPIPPSPPPQPGFPKEVSFYGRGNACTQGEPRKNVPGVPHNGQSIGLGGRHGRATTEKIKGTLVSMCATAHLRDGFDGHLLVHARQSAAPCDGARPEDLGCFPYNRDTCLEPLDFSVFFASGLGNNDWFQKAGETQTLSLEYRTYAFKLPRATRFVRICRDGSPSSKMMMEIDAILTNAPSCPAPSPSTGEPACDAECSKENTQPHCGCRAQWQAKARLRVGRKPAFWAAKYDPDRALLRNFYDHTGTDVLYQERLACTLGDGRTTYLKRSSKFGENKNHGDAPENPSMEIIDFRTTGKWTDVDGPFEVQRKNDKLDPADRWAAAHSCECSSDFAPNPIVPKGFKHPVFPLGSTHGGIVRSSPIHPEYPPSINDDGGHVCNDDTLVQKLAFGTGKCEPDHETCTDNKANFSAPEDGTCATKTTFAGYWSGELPGISVTPLPELIPPGTKANWDRVGLIGQKAKLGIHLAGEIGCEEQCRGVPIGKTIRFPVSKSFYREIGVGVGVKAHVPYLWLFKGGWFLARNAVPLSKAILENKSLLWGMAEFVIQNRVLPEIDLNAAASQACTAASKFPSTEFVHRVIAQFPAPESP